MAVIEKLLVVVLLFSQFLQLGGFKVLTLAFMGGSHYLLMDEISNILHKRGHEVRMLLQEGVRLTPGRHYEHSDTYQVTKWSASENVIDEYNKWFHNFTKDCLKGRTTVHSYLDLMGHLASQCHFVLNESRTLSSLKQEKFHLAVIDAFNPCSFLVAEKLGLPFVAVYPGTFVNAPQAGIPSPLSYVPLAQSLLSDRMDFWERLKNCLMSLFAPKIKNQIYDKFDNVIREHFPATPRPALPELYLKAELWIYDTDFSIEFVRPLLPSTVYIGGLLAKPAKPLPQEFEDFIESTGEAGFIIVTLGSMLSSIPFPQLLKEINKSFAQLPQGVIWRYQVSHWPKEINLAPNVKIAEWLPQNDLLGHPKVRLFVTHGGLNSLMESVYHGVPVVGIPLFGDQHDNMIRVEARNMGLSVSIDQLEANSFGSTMKQVIGDQRYKAAAEGLSTILRSHPFPPEQRLAGWIEHVLKVGSGTHLQPHAFHQMWYQQYLLDVWLFLIASLLGMLYLCLKLIGYITLKACNTGKQKQA
ncbi:LOW QUALITY PROTEIN: UDP-glucuronosyltransferase 3A1-like [Sceloporus undulatus]|uniref:LOW QUALITY PROTEIN: UDP-glucuronosyltransferase 3A1-like n=1 Tax=Sceloporus undulatus TaxID=8520 RepID=UPI001C4D2874|nr:LOW QUALITY PROTEIN: UDP-glucuronosyltransferase 3A1-like [Sceloporus undulatus]